MAPRHAGDQLLSLDVSACTGVRLFDVLPNNSASILHGSWQSPHAFASRLLNAAFFIYLITRDVYKTGSSSKRPPQLWITANFSTSSTVYVMLDVLNKRCIRLARNAYRFRGAANDGRSAHSLLWICMRLSTARCQVWPSASPRDAWCSPAARQSRPGEQDEAGASRLDVSTQQFEARTKKKFSKRFARKVSGLQPRSVYKNSSSVNKWHFLWISRLTDEKSLVYGLYKAAACPCIAQLANLDKISRQ